MRTACTRNRCMMQRPQSSDLDQDDGWWKSAAELRPEVLARYGLSVARYPFVFGWDLSSQLRTDAAAQPAALWVAVGRLALTTLVVDDYAMPYVLRLDLRSGGVEDVRVTARLGQLLSGHDLKALPLTSTMSDLAFLGDVFLEHVQEVIDGEPPCVIQTGTVREFSGPPAEALFDLIALLQKRRARHGQAEELRARVVELYRQAVAGELGEAAARAPRKAVSRLVFKSEAHVGRLLVEARREGRLEKTTPGRKNQATDSTERSR